ncbi:MAG TPA: alpha/beta hydrolase [Tepidisphaeraceae bacterium]|nr:alpha/beta hydrolase [Tepidisphaeraceae bacterium]
MLLLLAALLLLAGTGCSRFDVLNATVPSWGYRQNNGISYGQAARQKLDVYQPGSQKKGAPIVVFFYGGGWQNGQRTDYRFVAEAFTSYGYVTVIPDYRLYPEVTFPAFVVDGAMALRWVQENAARFDADPSRIFLVGHSAGAHIAALLMYDESYLNDVGFDRAALRATAGISGPYDFKATGFYEQIFPQQDDPQTRRDFNPIYYVDGSEPPMLMLQGTDDKLVEQGNAIRLAKRVRAQGGQARHLRFRGGNHSDTVLSLAWSFRWLTPSLRYITTFFREHDPAVVQGAR